MNKKLLLTLVLSIFTTIQVTQTQEITQNGRGALAILSQAKNPKDALDKLINLINKNTQYAQGPYFQNALSYIANKFPCSGYFLSYNLPVELQKDFESWYDNYAKNNPQEQIITTLIDKMSTFHDNQAKLTAQDQSLFTQIQIAEFKDLFKHLQDLGINLNDVVFCEELNHNLITYAFSKDVEYPQNPLLTDVILKSYNGFNTSTVSPEGKTLLGTLQELVTAKQKENNDPIFVNNLRSLIAKITSQLNNYSGR